MRPPQQEDRHRAEDKTRLCGGGFRFHGDETRPVPIPPELIVILREHIEMYGVAAGGRHFRTSKDTPFPSRRSVYTASAPSIRWLAVRSSPSMKLA